MATQVFAFAKIVEKSERHKVYKEIKKGKSRFGMWEQTKSLREEYHGKNGFLLRIKEGDWIVHVNMPDYGKCVAVQAVGGYDFDDGIQCSWGTDFCNYIPVDIYSIVEFDRNDPNVITSVNLAPMRRGQRILEVSDFLQSINNLKNNIHSDNKEELKGLIHLKEKISQRLLPEVTKYIHKMNKSKEFERFLKRIFDGMPNTVSVANGFGWGTDYGADLIIDFKNPIIGINLTSKIVVQVKSYIGDHNDLNAVDQIVDGIQKYQADGGLLITTGNKTEKLEDYLQKRSEEIGKTIDLIAGPDVAKFVIRYAPDVLIGNN
ncbi:restriction endonuclease [Syntrophotalea acetylenica]|uniref:Restriction endonuclease type IV Mrr domain-containing protein n=1 Tax=Syntrophotalea acetylenica TaxID=29542 RepID=A0A1L3GJ63_SYNAC|nr:restriction endonuclease [Syntrophotalea acetylenica]APG25951.1 hypothetical protein A7E75_13755 [Syntrophotalea acetylenica]APG44019.1 hypothetical protein A6070_07780 [Syntrophotalea acetylenica]